uniref:Uncharacterized protein n=1 Tax=Oryza punctata TaxID=4537 RepID=A0A0E0LKX8_ORYPU
MASSMLSAGRTQWVHRLEDYLFAVKALAWCPFQSNLLASGGGGSKCAPFVTPGPVIGDGAPRDADAPAEAHRLQVRRRAHAPAGLSNTVVN